MLPTFRERTDKYDDDLELGRYWSRSVTPDEAEQVREAIRGSLVAIEDVPRGEAVLGKIPLGGRRLLGLLPPKDRAVAVLANDRDSIDLFWAHCTFGIHACDGGSLVMSLVADNATSLADPAGAFDDLLAGLAAGAEA